MIDFIRGTLFSINEDTIAVDVNGIGYLVYVARAESYNHLLKQECFIYTHHYFREDWMGLFGFKEKDERHLFRLLLSVSGIGPKGALAVIAQSTPNQIIKAIALEDEKTLTKMPGIGKKTAQRIILDLKDKVKNLNFKGKDNNYSHTDYQQEDSSLINSDSELSEALKALGYHELEINTALRKLSDSLNTEPLEVLIKKALQILMKE